MTLSSRALQIYLPLALVAVIVLGLAWPSVRSMLELWRLSSFQHAWLVPLISGYLFWIGRHSADRTPARPDPVGGLMFAAAIWLWLIGRLAYLQAVEHVAVWAMLNTAVWAVLGRAAYRRVMTPLLFLFLALPVGTSLVPVLMEVTATLAHGLLNLLGIPAYREGMFFSLPGGRFVVADVCGGHRYFTAGLCTATLFSILMFRSLAKGALFVVASVTFVVLINGIRAGIVMAVASATDMRYLSDDHALFGWLLFLGGMILTYSIGWRFADDGRLANQ